MTNEKGKSISAIGTFLENITMVDGEAHEWIDAKEFNLATLAKTIGVNAHKPVRLKITLEILDERCEFCGKLITSDQLCDKCCTAVCNTCTKETPDGDRLCPNCAKLQG